MSPTPTHPWYAGLLPLLSALVAALCWGPSMIEPSLALPFWLHLMFPAAAAGAATLLCRERWLAIWLASGFGCSAGLVMGFLRWWPHDPIAGPWVPLAVVALTAIHSIACLITTRGACRSARLSLPPRVLWTVLAACALYGPVVLALTYTIVIPPIAQRESIAEERFLALKAALDTSAAVSDDASFVCDPGSWRRFYRGAPLPESVWGDLARKGAVLNGYRFQITCKSPSDYWLYVGPERYREGGYRSFCADDSRRTGCWVGSLGVGRFRCQPCRR